ncbi:MAG: hypothetical protein K8R87_02810 [Verrucomicrobia bacterium]|nr:hypothetical protein [Verrucomicrobiota bacterium]
MKTTTTLKIATLTVATFALSLSSPAGDVTHCDKVFQEVRAAVEMEPQKILVIVEDAMVANESCACEIVKAAIMASKADSDLTKQIVLTATHVAPKMAPLIAECAGAITVGGGKGVVESVKQVIGVQPVEEVDGGSDYSLTPGDIRGVYLIQPSTGGFSSKPPTEDPPGGKKKVVTKRRPPKHSIPQSPSIAQGP